MGRIRIVAGSLKGRRLPVPEVPGLRPTPERVREALFSRLGDRLHGGRVVDAFAGTGSLGLEALSRGADRAIFLERHPAALEALHGIVDAWGLAARATIVPGDAVLWPRRTTEVVDAILADPPYEGPEGTRFLEALGGSPCLRIGGILGCERAAKAEIGALQGFRLEKSSRYGDSALDLWIRET